MRYVDLHVHTEASYRDGVTSVKEVFERTRELGRNAVAITDHGNLTRMFKAFRYASNMQRDAFTEGLKTIGAQQEDIDRVKKAYGDFGNLYDPDAPAALRELAQKYPEAAEIAKRNSVKFIPGVEMYTQGPENENSNYHIILLGKDWIGMKALFKLCNLAQLNKGGLLRDQPRVTLETLNEFVGPGSEGHGHVVATSACMQGHLCQILLSEFKLLRKIAKLEEKKQELPVVFADGTLEARVADIERSEQELADAKFNLRETKALAGKKVESKIARLKAKIEKMQAQAKDTTKEEEELDALFNQKYLIDEAIQVLPAQQSVVETLKDQLAQKKENFKQLEKAIRPQIRINNEIDALQKELSGLSGLEEKAIEMAKVYDNIFGHGNYFIELQRHGISEEEACYPALKRISEKTNIPLTVANDVHFCKKEDRHKRDLISSMRFNKPIQEAESRPGNGELYFKSDDEMAALFPEDTEALTNTLRIAEMCNVFYHKEMHLPTYVDEKGRTPQQYLLESSREGFRKRYPNAKATWDRAKFKAYGERVTYELGVIHSMGFDSYIAIVQDFIAYARNTYGRALVGPGRGSGAGSLVNYLLGITDIDPMRYGLVFERFLNPERVSMPDIDTDFAPTIRDNVIKYVTDRYAYTGEYREEIKATVANIATEGTLAARSSIRGVGRVVFGDAVLPLCDKLAKLVPMVPGMTLKKALEDVKELKAIYDTNAQAKHIIDDALLVEGLPVNTGVHAAGVIIADKPISEYSPMFFNEEKNCWVVQYDMVSCESDIGLLKMDFLGLKNLDIINEAIASVKRVNGVDVDIDELQRTDDRDVIKNIYAKGDTDGIFQFESGGMKRTLREFQPESIDDVILMNAAYRPGPMDYIPRITDVKLGKAAPQYIVPSMEKIMANTYGSPIYQEQIMQLFQEVGFTLGQSDIIRRAMSKKHLDEIEAAKEQFVDGMRKQGADDSAIETFWQELLEFAKYAFNKSHAAAYSVVSYYTAWLKYYYPAETYSALLSHTDNSKFDMYINDAKAVNVQTLEPCVNESMVDFVPVKGKDGKAIRFGLGSIKGVASNAERVVAERVEHGKYTSFESFVARAVIAGIKKETVELLAKAGATACFNGNYASHVESAELMYSAGKSELARLLKRNPEATYEEMLESISKVCGLNIMPVGEYPASVKAKMEKDCLGTYLSGSPLDGVVLPTQDITNVCDMTEDTPRGVSITAAGYVDNITLLARKSDGAKMAKFTFGDRTGTISAICFVESYAKNKHLLTEGAVVKLQGRVKVEKDDTNEVKSRDFVVQEVSKIL